MVAHEGATTTVVFVDGATVVARWRLPVRRANLATVDALARLALWARRRGWTMQVRKPCPPLVELLVLAGLADLLAEGALRGEVGRQPEETEQLRAQEVVVPRDPPV